MFQKDAKNHWFKCKGLHLVLVLLLLPVWSWAQANLSLDASIEVSSSEGPFVGDAMIDGDPVSRWGSDWLNAADPAQAWFVLDFGEEKSLAEVELVWEAAYASRYRILISSDGSTWDEVHVEENGQGGTEVHVLNENARYLRWEGVERATGYGYSLFEVVVSEGNIVVDPTHDNLAFNKSVTTRSTEGYWSPEYMLDGDLNTRWSSDFSLADADDEWIEIDLGETVSLGQAVLRWEAASASAYTILGSTDSQSWTPLESVANAPGGNEAVALDGDYRYLRFEGQGRSTGYGYSLWEFEVYAQGDGPEVPVPFVGGGVDPDPDPDPDPADFYTLNVQIPYVEYLEVGISPPDVEGGDLLKLQNVSLTTNLVFPANTIVELSERQSSLFGRTLIFEESGNRGIPLTVLMNQNRSVVAVLEQGEVEDAPVYNDPIHFPEAQARPGDFLLESPAHAAHIVDTREVNLNWQSVAGAESYDVYLNITKTNYDFSQSGEFLERYTKIASTSSTSVLTSELSDRWTYRWYVVAHLADGSSVTSENRRFSLYIPEVENVNDGIAIINGCRDLNKNGSIEPFENWRLPIEQRIDDLMSRMTLEEKVYQLFFNVQEHSLSGWHFGPGSSEDLFTLQLNSAATRLGIPFISAGDTTHGYKTTYPAGISMAATRDPSLLYQLANMQREEHLVSGYRGVLAPISEVGTKAIYPRIQEGGGEDAYLVAELLRAHIVGLQNGPELNPGSVFPTTKHWPSQGSGGEGGITYDEVTIKYHMIPWYGVIEAATGGVMPGYAGSRLLDPNGSGAGDSIPILQYLREVMNYDGLIMTDWLPQHVWVKAFNAGSDVMGGANPGDTDMNAFMANIDKDRLSRSLRRVLRVKFSMGIFESPYGDLEKLNTVFHTPEKAALAQKAAEKSITLIKNDNLLPLRLDANSTLLVTGPRADDSSAHGIWTSFFHADYGAKTYAEAIAEKGASENVQVRVNAGNSANLADVDVAIVAIGEAGYTHGTTWLKTEPYIKPETRALIQSIEDAGIPMALVYFMPRPYVITWENALAEAVVVTYRPGDGGGAALAEFLWGDVKPQGKLPFQLPLDISQVGGEVEAEALEDWNLPYDLGASEAERGEIYSLINQGIKPEPIYGNPLYQYDAGIVGNFGLSDSTAPSVVHLSGIAQGDTLVNTAVYVTWPASFDPDTGVQGYELIIDGEVYASSAEPEEVRLQLANGPHTAIIRTYNWAEGYSESSPVQFTVQDTASPTIPSLISPLDNQSISEDVNLIWQPSLDDSSGLMEYRLLLDNGVVETLPAVSLNPQRRNIALEANATASTAQGGLPANNAIDGDPTTRWGSASEDGQFILVDFGSSYSIDELGMLWETAYAEDYVVEVSLDGDIWEEALTVIGSVGGSESYNVSVDAARYLRLRSTKRATVYGVSLFELTIMGTPVLTDSLQVAPGVHTVQVQAVDYAGNIASSESVTISK